MASQQGGEGKDCTASEIEDANRPLVTSITGMIAELPPVSPDICIYRAPQRVRQLNEKAYTPRKVSIGPLHHGEAHLLPMEEQKWRYLRAFLDRTKLSLEGCISFIRGLEDRVRNCYLERVDFTSDDFVKMILVDSSFIIEVIWRYKYNLLEKYFISKKILMEEKETDLLNRQIMLLDVVQEDMILLENQIPYFVLEGLFNLAFPSQSGDSSFFSLSVEYFLRVSLFNEISFPIPIPNSQVKHFVDLLRVRHLPSTPRLPPPNHVPGAIRPIPTARHLQEVGLSFEKGSSNNIFDIRYANGVLEIPRFDVIQDSSAEIVFRNLIAFEICHYESDTYIAGYVFFMNALMENEQDVDVLIQKGIFENWFTDRASVKTFFHNLTSDGSFFTSNFYYLGLRLDINEYCRTHRIPWHSWKEILKRDYCSTPWRVVSTVAAIVLLVLTLIQTICSVISLLQKK